MRTLMKTTVLLSFFLVLMGCKEEVKPEIAQNIPQEVFAVDGITINDPKTVENLSLFILTGKEKVIGKNYNTLSEAMERKQVTVKETGSVNELAIDNNSSDYVFIHSGDIVKGGKQDRTISYDVIIPPNTKDIPLESFCVEQGRWQQRADEQVVAFSTNTKMLSSRDLKLAAKHENNQGKVWSKVSEQKEYLNEKLSLRKGYDVDVAANESNSSLQLALESDELKKSRDSIYEKLKDLIDTPDAIGYAYAINGEIYGVEVYNNKQLFADLWDKILESVIVEAISKEGEEAEAEKSKKEVLVYMEAVKANDKKTSKILNKATKFRTIKNEKGNIVFSTEDLEKQKWIHKSYMKVDTSATAQHENGLLNTRLRIEN
ncbi:hypothetical protein FEE95_08985 [Maribacter algarum]|uniref:ARG and Rhodanese-Phosphatase-superfamily-associated domain-containing protein n=1 Tax=Maribacter algarum (ex Zhang et al. 2020) TaxID=2578118 RepID=A0A5S3PPG5_9FLAO|nr:DUF6569 family protein [Maribacter algarum]TMM56630.1 hypothetical protein FEE95_08985 [Maribacter algarum]